MHVRRPSTLLPILGGAIPTRRSYVPLPCLLHSIWTTSRTSIGSISRASLCGRDSWLCVLRLVVPRLLATRIPIVFSARRPRSRIRSCARTSAMPSWQMERIDASMRACRRATSVASNLRRATKAARVDGLPSCAWTCRTSIRSFDVAKESKATDEATSMDGKKTWKWNAR